MRDGRSVRRRGWAFWGTAFLGTAAWAVQHGANVLGAEAMVRQATHVYKVAGDAELTAHAFTPADAGRGESRPAVVMFHGGGWHRGGPEWCYPECRYFAARGLVAIAIEYRLAGGEGTPLESMADAKSAIRWVRAHAEELGVDPDRVAAGGCSSGGHLAAAAATLESFDEPREDAEISSVPNALLLWYPAVDVARDPWFARLLGNGAEVADCSPASNVRAGAPPAIVFQGDADDLTPIRGAKLFADEAAAAGNRCDLHIYPGRAHLFTDDPRDYADTMQRADRFLVSLGFLEGEPDLAAIEESRSERGAFGRRPGGRGPRAGGRGGP